MDLAQTPLPEKQPQAKVNYRPAEQPLQSCKNCSHFDGQKTCDVVEGNISPTAVCDLFEEPVVDQEAATARMF